MSGNVYEWVNDNYQPDYYEQSPEHNPPGPATGKPFLDTGFQQKVARGGSIYDFDGNTTVTRLDSAEHYVYRAIGFRCAMGST